MKRWRFAVTAMAFWFATLAYGAENKCEFRRYGELPVTMAGTQPMITGTINGQPARFLADSGAFFSFLSKSSAEKFGLKTTIPPVNILVTGIGGTQRVGYSRVKSFTLNGFAGGMELEGIEFLIGGSELGDRDGVIGQNILGGGDTEFDLANGFIRTFRSKNCDGVLAYWGQGMQIATMKIDKRNPASPHIIGEAKLNGKKIRVMFDTGAWRSVLTLKAAERAGVQPEDDGVVEGGVARGFGRRTAESSIARFDELDLGGEIIRNARLRIGDIGIKEADMLLGADFFLSHRIYVASTQNKLYFTYNGGPVFDLRANRNDPARGAQVASTPQESSQASDLEAAELRRRGAASLGRGDIGAAIADLDKAVELDAKDPNNFYQRALARLANGQPQRAMSDFDAALALDPAHMDALIDRALLRLFRGNEAGATADVQTALKLAPEDPAISFRVAEVYLRAGRFESTIKRLDSWLEAYPRHARVPEALLARCRSRSMLGKELETARADCDQALRRGPRNSVAFDTRGLVFLQLGDFERAIKDYQEALELQPKKASSLYGLGIAETRKGDQVSGAANMKAAIELDPNVARPYRRMGLVPN